MRKNHFNQDHLLHEWYVIIPSIAYEYFISKKNHQVNINHYHEPLSYNLFNHMLKLTHFV